MSKKLLTGRQMSSVEYVDEAAHWSRELTRMRTRCPGDMENAMRAIERDYGIDYWKLWQLRYQRGRFKDIGIGLYARIRAAYQAECERQQHKIALELEITKAKVGTDHPAVVSVSALVGEE